MVANLDVAAHPVGASQAERVEAGGGEGKRIDVVDGLRGVAILMVLVRHTFFDTVARPGFGAFFLDDTPIYPFMLLSNTWMGVNLFFLDSGFVLYLPYALGKRAVRRARDAKEIYVRRAFRLLPLYYLMLVVCLAFYGDRMKAPSFEIPAYATFAFPLFHETWQPRPNGLLWSIGIEVWFSLAFPLLVIVARRIGIARLLAGAIALSLSTRYLAYAGGIGWQKTATLNTLADSLVGRLDNFVLGMAAATLLARWQRANPGLADPSAGPRPDRAAVRPGVALAGAFLLYSASCWLWDRACTLGEGRVVAGVGGYALANGAFFVFLLAALRSDGLLRKVLSSAPLRWAGIRCYSLYLVHGPLLVLVTLAPAVPLRSLFLFLTFGLSYLTYRFVEKPGMAYGRRRAEQLAPAR
jgi:peptidoglycan/LPS O-acetylase OafA/YrhL